MTICNVSLQKNLEINTGTYLTRKNKSYLYTNMSKEDKQKLIEYGKINVKTV